ncbi:MAG: redoxin domain-containing protein, partial [Bacteroidetes bacterium]
SSDVYFMTFIRFSIASLDNIQHAADRNRYEKHDFYIKNFPVSYRNDAYMGYVSTFYEKMMPRLPMETNNRVYLGILKSSPTLIMRALGSEYTLINMRIREMVMIKALGEAFYTGEYPQTNILTILDSVSTTPLFQSNGIIAKNMIIRLTDLVPGGKAPDFAAANLQGEMKTLLNYRDKHLYIHFFDPTSQKSVIQTDPLIKLYEQYNKDVTFITICPEKSMDSVAKSQLDKIPWEKFTLDEKSPVFKLYKVSTFPYYILIDEMGYVVAAPALTPMPNGQYETIDKTFFYIKKAREEMEQYRR